MIILDTSVMIELIDGSEKGAKIREYLNNTKEDFAITVFTVHELLLPTTGREKEKLEEMLSEFQIFSFTYESSLESVRLNEQLKSNGTMLSKIDLFIASICNAQKASLFTLDGDFKRINGLMTIDID